MTNHSTDTNQTNESSEASERYFARRLLHNALGIVCTCLLAGLVGLTVFDVIGRYWFNAPVSGAFELTQLMLGALIFAALPLTTEAGEHVEVDIFYEMVPVLIKRLMRILGACISAVALWIIAWRLAHHAAKLSSDGAVTDALSLPLAPIGWFGAGAAALSGVLAIAYLARFSLADEMLDLADPAAKTGIPRGND